MLHSVFKWLTCALTTSLLVMPSFAWAWGKEGHCIVARIAEAHLSRKAREGIRDLIADRSIADPRIAVWADEIKRSSYYKQRYPNNQKWHFIDLDVSKAIDAQDFDKDCTHDDCVWKRVPEFVAVLKDPKADFLHRREALFFVVHLVGDAHQPLHCAERNGDHGGNMVRVKLPSDEGGHAPITNLHSVWDTELVHEAMAGLSWEDFADRLDNRIAPAQRTQWVKGDLKSWILDAHKLAREKAYAGVPEAASKHAVFSIPQEYLDDNVEVVKEQLQRGGVRLAKILNDAFE